MQNPREQFQAKKSLGQNFLKNPGVVQQIMDAAKLTGDELVVEVGPGFGILTEQLVKHARKVISIEKDERLLAGLKAGFITSPNFELIHGDALQIEPPTEPYFWIANIPYSITSPLLDHFIRDNPSRMPKRAVLLVQKEVAEKICVAPPRMNVLALHVQTFGVPRIVCPVSRRNFSPQPKVDSAVICIELITREKAAEHTADEYAAYFSAIHKCFAHKRKMLRSAFEVPLLESAGIDPTRRAETLSIEEWWRLAHTVEII